MISFRHHSETKGSLVYHTGAVKSYAPTHILIPSPTMTTSKIGIKAFKQKVVAGSFPEFTDLPEAIDGLQFVQADPIRAPARAQDLILRQRVNGYLAGDLEADFPDLHAEEGYLFAYGFMTPQVWRNLRWRQRGKLKKLEREVLEAVAEIGEAHPRSLDEQFGRKSVTNYWGGKSKETKKILENLHHHGFLRISRREQGIRIYQVPTDSSPPNSTPSELADRYRELVLATAHVFGPTSKRFLVAELIQQNHLVPIRRDRLAVVDALIADERLSEVDVGGVTYLWQPEKWQCNDIPQRVRILAPFDPLVRDRARFEQLWGWEYRFEAYVPAAKRQRGYYAMPLLWRDEVIGWANASVDQNAKAGQGCLRVEVGYAGKRPRSRDFRLLVEAEVDKMAIFLGLKTGAWELAL